MRRAERIAQIREMQQQGKDNATIAAALGIAKPSLERFVAQWGIQRKSRA